MPHGRRTIATIALLACAGGVSTGVQDPPPEPATTGGPTDEPALPSLDDLLGLDGAGGATGDKQALDRQLSAREAGERFQQAVGLMGNAATRIADAGDVGLETQRMQEDILRKLDQVIEAAKQNQSSSSSSSKSSSSKSQQNQQQPDQSTQAGQQPGGQPGAQGDQDHMGPGLSGVQLNPGVAPDGVTWGNLPEREREAVSQGVSDRYSALYRRLTELYYRKLAEQERDQ